MKVVEIKKKKKKIAEIRTTIGWDPRLEGTIDNDENKVNERFFKLTQFLRFRGESELTKLSPLL